MQQISATIPDEFKTEIDNWRKANPGVAWGKLIIDGYRMQQYLKENKQLLMEKEALSKALAKALGR